MLQALAKHYRFDVEPRLFSFNNPMGACPRCDGLGTVEFFDPKRIVALPNLSLASGAIRGWDRRNHFYFSMLQALAKHYRFDVEQPWEALDDRIQQLILHGSGAEKIAFRYPGEGGRAAVKEHAFEGVIPNHEQRYREIDSLVVREELAKLRNVRACRDCGARRATSRSQDTRFMRFPAGPYAVPRIFFPPCGLRGQNSKSPSASCARSRTGSASSSTWA